jgi:prepilin-type N-terminal cleavage/methylation domain-containing protein
MNARGFSLAEVMIAIVILAIGVIALGMSAGAITTMTAEGGRASEAASVAASRIETLRRQGCASMASGSATTGAYSETWRVTSPSTLLRNVTVQISYNTGRRTRSATFSTQVSCASQVQ